MPPGHGELHLDHDGIPGVRQHEQPGGDQLDEQRRLDNLDDALGASRSRSRRLWDDHSQPDRFRPGDDVRQQRREFLANGQNATIVATGGGVSTVGDDADALIAQGAGASVTGTSVVVKTNGSRANGVLSTSGGLTTISGGSVKTVGVSADGVVVNSGG